MFEIKKEKLEQPEENETWDIFTDIYTDILFNEVNFINPADILYHYTSPEGLLGIINNEKIMLRFSRYDCLNDINEGKELAIYYLEACNKSLKEGKISNEFFETINNIEFDFKRLITYKSGIKCIMEDREITIDTHSTYKECELYICCFSLEPDSLPMWNYYLKNGSYQGYNLGFNFNSTIIYDKSTEIGFEYHILPIIYMKETKIQIIRNIIEKFYNASVNSKDFSVCIDLIKDLLQNRILQFKSEHFAHENEVRIILCVPIDNSKIKREYGIKNGNLVPYVYLDFEKSDLYTVTIGPLTEKEISTRTLESLKKDYEGYDFIVEKSSVPIRY